MKRLVLHNDWQAIGKLHGSIPNAPEILQSEINNLYYFHDGVNNYQFRSKDYPHLQNTWINPGGSGGNVPSECVRMIVETP